MNPENYKTKRKGQPKKNNSAGRAKRRAEIKEWTPDATPKLREIYSTKTEWVTKIMPKVNVEAPKEIKV
ncbi:MAG: hypothetical protein ABSD92_06245 [Candidatus Bathyarchaeia archaeon]|jgi:hypothetical protein